MSTHSQLHAAQDVYDNLAEPDDSDETTAGLLYLIGAAENALGRAERCIRDGNIQTAIDIMRSAGVDLQGATWD